MRRLPKYRPPTSPGDMLKSQFLEPLKMSQAEFARRCKVKPKVINEICQGKRAVTARTSIIMSEVLGTSYDFWLGLQMDLDLWHEIQEFSKKKKAS